MEIHLSFIKSFKDFNSRVCFTSEKCIWTSNINKRMLNVSNLFNVAILVVSNRQLEKFGKHHSKWDHNNFVNIVTGTLLYLRNRNGCPTGQVKKSAIPKRAGTMDKSISTGIKYWVCCRNRWFFHLSRRTTVIQDLLVRRQFSLVPENRTNVYVEACIFFARAQTHPLSNGDEAADGLPISIKECWMTQIFGKMHCPRWDSIPGPLA
jgi:hypothetical protein